jgi:hypothetical protein
MINCAFDLGLRICMHEKDLNDALEGHAPLNQSRVIPSIAPPKLVHVLNICCTLAILWNLKSSAPYRLRYVGRYLRLRSETPIKLQGYIT